MGTKRQPARRAQAKKTSHRKPKSNHGLKIVGLLCALVLLVPSVAFAVAYIVTDVPQPGQLITKQVSTIYASDGSTELARIVPPEGNRRVVSIDKIPAGLKAAVISAEDRHFYDNPGFSITGFARAVIGQLTGNTSAGGGSTITQQYVKNALVGNERSLRRKLSELVVSAKMANQWSKDTVLAAYLNTIYFGRSSYGVAAAAQAYFGTDVSQLSVAQSAVLAAAIQAPSKLDPWTNPGPAKARWDYVIDGMVKTGFITDAQRKAMVYPQVKDPATVKAFTQAKGTNGLIKRQVMEELKAHGISAAAVETKGLKIVTTIDPVVQEAVVAAVDKNRPTWDKDIRQAVVSVDPTTGGVAGYYGGDDPTGWDYAVSARPTGSTFKVFGLAAALQQGIGLNQIYSSAPVKESTVTITNVGGEGCGSCSIATALKHSYNTSFIRLEKDLYNGPQDVADMAHALGVARTLPGIGPTLTEKGQTPFNGIILGQYDTRPLDMAVGLATLANLGVWHQPHFVTKVTDAAGATLYSYQPGEGQRRVSANVAANVLKAMAPIAAWSNRRNLAGGRPSAAKTGTVQLGDTYANKDAWFIGATPQLATAVWVGTNHNTPLKNSWGGPMYGAGLPGVIWKKAMDQALASRPIAAFPAPHRLGYASAKIAPARRTYTYYGDGYSQTPSRSASVPSVGGETGHPGAGGAASPGNKAPAKPAAPARPAKPKAPPKNIEILPGIKVPNLLGIKP